MDRSTASIGFRQIQDFKNRICFKLHSTLQQLEVRLPLLHKGQEQTLVDNVLSQHTVKQLKEVEEDIRDPASAQEEFVRATEANTDVQSSLQVVERLLSENSREIRELEGTAQAMWLVSLFRPTLTLRLS